MIGFSEEVSRGRPNKWPRRERRLSEPSLNGLVSRMKCSQSKVRTKGWVACMVETCRRAWPSRIYYGRWLIGCLKQLVPEPRRL